MERSSFSSRKRQKKEKDAEQNSDRLSGLPDDVLCHILSFLPTKRSVGTSILSKRWMSLWAHVPALEFESDTYPSNVQTLVNPDIITSVMFLPEAPTNLNTFRLRYVKCSELILKTWITAALRRNVRIIELVLLKKKRFYTLPQRLFTCKTLVELKLGNCNCVPSSCHVFFPSLKKLCLHSVEYDDDEALPHLLSGCPVLGELELSNTRLSSDYDHEDFVCEKIFSSTVKTLKVDFCCGCAENPDCRIIINTPSLRYLDVKHCCLSCLTILPNTMTSLIKADLFLVAYLGYSDNAVNFLNSLCKVKCLKITTDIDEPFDLTFCGSVVKFDNLTKLELELGFDWHGLVKFLGLANNLEELEVNTIGKIYVEPKQEPTCLLSRLRTISIDSLKSDIEDFNMVRYFLRNAQVLERMELRVDFDKEKLEELERISLFEGGSRACPIELIIH